MGGGLSPSPHSPTIASSLAAGPKAHPLQVISAGVQGGQWLYATLLVRSLLLYAMVSREGCVLQLGATLLSTHPVLTWIVLFFCCCSEGAELVSSIVKKNIDLFLESNPLCHRQKIRRVNVKMAARRR